MEIAEYGISGNLRLGDIAHGVQRLQARGWLGNGYVEVSGGQLMHTSSDCPGADTKSRRFTYQHLAGRDLAELCTKCRAHQGESEHGPEMAALARSVHTAMLVEAAEKLDLGDIGNWEAHQEVLGYLTIQVEANEVYGQVHPDLQQAAAALMDQWKAAMRSDAARSLLEAHAQRDVARTQPSRVRTGGLAVLDMGAQRNDMLVKTQAWLDAHLVARRDDQVILDVSGAAATFIATMLGGSLHMVEVESDSAEVVETATKLWAAGDYRQVEDALDVARRL